MALCEYKISAFRVLCESDRVIFRRCLSLFVPIEGNSDCSICPQYDVKRS